MFTIEENYIVVINDVEGYIYIITPDDSGKVEQLCAHVREIGHSEYRQRFDD